jgi:colicin import membrane protein
MKAALAAWGSNSNLFHQGFAKEVDDPEIVAATMSMPGVILRRPVGSSGPFKEDAKLPNDLPPGKVKPASKAHRAKPKRAGQKVDDKAARKAALAYEKDQKQRESARRKQEAAQAKMRQRRERAVAQAQTAIEKAKQAHEERAGKLEAERAALEKRITAEDASWEKQLEKLEKALRRARH